MITRRGYAAAAAVALTLTPVVTGCTGSAAVHPAGAGTPRSAVTPMPVIATATPSRPSDIVLPITPYLFTDAQSSQLVAAHVKLASACMRRYGFGYSVPAAPVAPEQLPVNESRYGVMTPDQARYGYHFMAVEMKRLRAGAAPIQDPPKVTPAMAAVLWGSSSGPVDGRSVPSGGCNGEATTELGGRNGRYGDPDIAESIQADSYDRSQSDPRVLKAFAAWSACMRADGYDYPSPNAATNDPRWSASAEPSAAEIATARADVACKRRTNLVGVWASVESAYQDAAIELNADSLRQARATMQRELRTAATLLGSSQ
ncbi:hypothetical protein [Streptacidiphilus sp. P02-A3a]|uniref:hypothetical protein n=1 Tax=Streptacidiphilus sp. P02-A3a TaxID=2704468 RepID=UPI0015FAC585|nr:hypothetical protein [Streptacidiphilus sp. P02-A3a]QMU69593.1 hypothetical protein GXP74_16465 [Streptacidiphilus sp. P02-A3a]